MITNERPTRQDPPKSHLVRPGRTSNVGRESHLGVSKHPPKQYEQGAMEARLKALHREAGVLEDRLIVVGDGGGIPGRVLRRHLQAVGSHLGQLVASAVDLTPESLL